MFLGRSYPTYLTLSQNSDIISFNSIGIPQMNSKYALIDTANTFFRARHIASRNSDTSEKIGMALHLTLASVNQVVRLFGAEHVVFCLEGRSFRKDLYKPYKAHRVLATQALTESEAEENKMFWETYELFTTYLREKTNVSVLRNERAEADDMIARFIHLHPNDHHYIISSDSDYIQLISENVHQYNGISNQLITLDGYHDEKGRLIVDKKTKEPKLLGDPKFVLFEKCMRGDASDNVFSAYPGVRTKGSKNKIGLTEAYADRNKQGFAWNNMMLQRWVDHNGVEHKVRDDYERNCGLIDLTAQPNDIKEAVDKSIQESVRTVTTPQVGIHFMKFCGKYELTKLSQQLDSYAKWLNNPYKGHLVG
jgi:5'-3' exonuclease